MANTFFTRSFAIMCISLSLVSFKDNSEVSTPITAKPATIQAAKLAGAWRLTDAKGDDRRLEAGATAVKIVSEGHFSIAYFNKEDKKFIGTYGGTYTLKNGQYTENYEFNTFDSTRVGTSSSFQAQLQDNKVALKGTAANAARQESWERVDQASAQTPLAGTWRITGRANEEGKMSEMQQGPRKTFKMLSGGRFQWIAFNTETKQFSGTGGGTYTAENGKYVETIEFFSRDPNRVGATLTFDFEVKGNQWHHKGLSSAGAPIYEIWTKQ